MQFPQPPANTQVEEASSCGRSAEERAASLAFAAFAFFGVVPKRSSRTGVWFLSYHVLRYLRRHHGRSISFGSRLLLQHLPVRWAVFTPDLPVSRLLHCVRFTLSLLQALPSKITFRVWTWSASLPCSYEADTWELLDVVGIAST